MADEWLVAGLLRELTECFAGEKVATIRCARRLLRLLLRRRPRQLSLLCCCG
jgi:hypothetical protein